MSLEIDIPISFKCPHCGKDALKINIPLPLEKAAELIKAWKGK